MMVGYGSVPSLGTTICRALTATATTVAIAGIAGLTFIRLQGCQLLSVQTASMLPAVRPADVLVVAPVLPSRLHAGDIISYRNPRDPNVIISHRLTSIDRDTGWLTTEGDALHSPDPAFPPRLLIGRAAALVPRLGLLLDTLRQPLGLALAVYLPAALVISAEVHRLAQAYARPFYSVRLKV